MSFDPLSALFDIGGKLIDKLIPNPEAKAAAAFELLKLKQSGELAVMANETALAKIQTDINIEEAKNSNVFVSGWRPFIGWVCGCGLCYQLLVYPILIAYVPKVVQLDMGTLITLLGGMLGLGTLRTFEKTKGVAS